MMLILITINYTNIEHWILKSYIIENIHSEKSTRIINAYLDSLSATIQSD